MIRINYQTKMFEQRSIVVLLNSALSFVLWNHTHILFKFCLKRFTMASKNTIIRNRTRKKHYRFRLSGNNKLLRLKYKYFQTIKQQQKYKQFI